MKALSKLTQSLSKLTGRTGLQLQKHSPEILLVVGIAGTVTSAVLACRATLKVDAIMENHHDKIDRINDVLKRVDDGEIVDDYTNGMYDNLGVWRTSEKDYQKDLTVAYVQTGVDFVKLYGPSVTLGIASIVCIIGSNGIMKRRNVALMAAYKAVEEGFNAYRKRVVEEYGEEKDYAFRHNLREEEITETVVGEDGKSKKVKKTVLSPMDPNGYSMYAKIFDESCSEWSPTPEYNFMFLRAQQNYCNDMLKARGHLFLNEVYEMLGLPHTQAGAVTGWVISKDGDNFVDFGIFDGDSPRARAFVNGYERNIWLDFNVDGVIYDLIEEREGLNFRGKR